MYYASASWWWNLTWQYIFKNCEKKLFSGFQFIWDQGELQKFAVLKLNWQWIIWSRSLCFSHKCSGRDAFLRAGSISPYVHQILFISALPTDIFLLITPSIKNVFKIFLFGGSYQHFNSVFPVSREKKTKFHRTHTLIATHFSFPPVRANILI